MAYTKEQKINIFNSIISVMENGASLRSAIIEVKDTLDKSICIKTFDNWINEDEELLQQYTRAKDSRTDVIFEEILAIADSQEGDIIKKDGVDVVNHDVINRARLRIDARKWMLGKMNKRKYGDAIDMTTDGKEINVPTSIQVEIIKNEDTSD
jgi:hypothetical protein